MGVQIITSGDVKMRFDDIPNSTIREMVDEYIHSERDRNILKRRLIDGICYEPLAEEFELSTPQVKRIVKAQSKRLLQHIM